MITSSGALCILCAFISTANGVRLSACVNGLLTINETLSSYDILCDMIDTSRLVEWTLNRPTTNAVALGSCSGNGSCQPTKPGQFDLSRSGGSSTLTIAQSQYSSIGTFSISCAGKEDPVIPACGLNIVNPPVVTCTANFTSGSWTLNIECVLTGTYSSRDTYWCTAYRGQSQISQPPIIDNQTYSPTVNRQGSCSLSVNKLGGVTSVPGDIQLYFRVDVYPGPTSVVQGPLSIVHPIEPTITCPAIVEENAPFTCTCSTSKIGHPQGRLWWSGTLSVNVTGNYGDSSLATPSLTLTRQDHGATNLTCEVMWAEGTYRRIYTANVSYKAENLQLIINSFTQPNVTVNENDTVTFTCNAAARPVATMVLEKEGKSNLSTSESPLDYKLSMAKCEDTGRYRCFAGNILGQSATLTKLLLVNCIPRSDTVDLGELNFQNRSLQIPFIVTAYPMPLNFSFTYIGPNGTDPPVVIVNIDLSASCTPESGLIMFTCTLTVSNVTSPNAQGHYVVTVGNTAGRQDYTFYLLYNGPNLPATNNDGQSSGINAAAIGGGIGGAVVVLIVVIVIVVIVLRRRNASPDKERLNVSIKTDNGNHTKTQGPVNPPDQPLSFKPCALQNAGDQQCETLQQANHAPHSSQAQHKKPQKSKPTDKAKTKKKNKGAKEDDNLHVYGNMPLTEQKMKQQSPQESAAAKPKKEGEGLIYSELDFQGKPSVQPPVQKDLETVIYSDIKVSVTVNPHNA